METESPDILGPSLPVSMGDKDNDFSAEEMELIASINRLGHLIDARVSMESQLSAAQGELAHKLGGEIENMNELQLKYRVLELQDQVDTKTRIERAFIASQPILNAVHPGEGMIEQEK